MRLLLLAFISLVLATHQVHSQPRPLTKIFIYNPLNDFQIATTATTRLRISSIGKYGYTLIETDFDSLGLIALTGQTVFLVFEPAKAYYYGYSDATYREMTPNSFWLSVAALSKVYHHYVITRQSGVVKVE